jgi:hypothetical protein
MKNVKIENTKSTGCRTIRAGLITHQGDRFYAKIKQGGRAFSEMPAPVESN